MRPLRSKTGLTPPPSLSTKKYRENNPMDQFSRNSHNHTRVSVIKPSCRKTTYRSPLPSNCGALRAHVRGENKLDTGGVGVNYRRQPLVAVRRTHDEGLQTFHILYIELS